MAKKNFEESLSRLEQIARELEEGELSLEDSLKKFNEGVKLAEFCNARLDEAQRKIDLLVKKDECLESVPLEQTDLQDELKDV